ncbi:restriction endonuclease subunit S [Halomonas binhaiensis]|uniref:Restriction endonuclease subunit S n=1 Tax=Halomonas binhaiensis TaxID=2562282 RepID=A0A5C1NK81_9GAMM|nr:restriction endonuclease subunit S [Halomonas binhaiensis]QEM83754.1 restriction endonuclease subunit S [Halomonas binhaiensis]
MSLFKSPDLWHSSRLEDLFSHIIGGDWGKSPECDESGYELVACIRGSEFKNWLSDNGKTAVQRKVKISSLEKRSLVPGDILLEISGGGPEQPVGRTVLISQSVIDQFSEKVVGTNFLRLMRPSEYMDPRFIKYFLDVFYLSGEIVNYQGGSNNLRNLKFKDFSQVDVPVATLSEQKIIVEKLDTLLGQVEATKARLERIPQILKRFRQSVLAAAVSGKLTEEWRGDSQYSSIFGIHCAPQTWEVSNLGDKVEYVTSGSRGWAKYYSVSGALFVRSQDINTDKIEIESAAYVSLPDSIEGRRTRLEIDDILLTITGANVTKCARVVEDLGEAYISQHVALIRLKETEQSLFVEIALKALNAGRKQLTDMAYGGGKPGLNLQNIKDVILAFPSLEEQTEIVRRVDQLFAYADTIEKQVNAALERVNHLTQSILAKAFRGELTAQWREENPELISGENSAEALLERIKAERAAQAPKKRGRKSAI